MAILPLEVGGKSGAARRFFKKQPPDTKQAIREAIRKVCANPYADHRRFAIRYLRGEWQGYLEYRIREPLLRVIYRVTETKGRLIFIEEITPHL